MNFITLFILAAALLGFLGPVLTILSIVDKGSQARAKETERARALQIRQDDADRRANLHQAKIELEAAKLELASLKILELRKKMSLDTPDFQPKDYTS